MRLDKFLTHNTDLSRSLASKAIKQKRVTINGQLAVTGALKLQSSDQVAIDGQIVLAQGARYFMMHKPHGTVCANSDPDHPLIFDLMVNEPRLKDLHTVGRLDKDTTGLLLITDDGAWSHTVTSPKRHVSKEYHADLAEPLSEAAKLQLEKGVMLHGEDKPTLEAQVELVGPKQIIITIHEGRYHQVKRMLAAVGNRVVKLHRQAIGGLHLDPELEPGQYRLLTDIERIRLQKD